ncbi:winged helix-turn-helix transcriptional regulator [Propionibacterium australiense]|uniref:Helix-turn-helix, HxlR type n=1 Tax=Propionibacterium australiense TaxID=119981 RepID=A0A383S8C5_9ACTN|nr:helix-turn-helix domain-containing protein [Propionibacterium australiense]RLP07712.1 transcriptional regulator [Propionibacterium australiense]RLP08141.1 transcriptional regulator [Propionibacterium australiense]SYZ33674.1 Helix-turn-helix, HxlR type [Propionibacterium australiense]VEH92960.1 HTH-type transcriptional activator hxlR [Propionibacterium australiense]
MTETTSGAAGGPFNPYSRACPSRRLLKFLGDLWTVLVIGALYDAGTPQRFTEISLRVDGISTKMLTSTLRRLERNGLVLRQQYAETPPRVTYELSPAGQDLAGILREVEAWATSHMQDVLAARDSYDAAHEA